MAKPKIQFRIRHFGDLRNQPQRDSWEKIWKGWKARIVPWQNRNVIPLATETKRWSGKTQNASSASR